MGFRQSARGDYLMTTKTRSDAEWAFDAYEAVRHRLPGVRFEQGSLRVNHLGDLCDRVDVFLLDAFGVLNVGEDAIPGAPERIRALQAAGKTVMVVSNAAGYPKRLLLEKYARLGFDFAPEEVLTSREVLLHGLQARGAQRYGLMASKVFGLEELEHLDAEFLAEDAAAYDRAEAFLMIGAAEWTETRQGLLEASLRANPRPVLVGNPDIVAPRVDGLSREPGYFAHRLADATGVKPEFFGKPFANVFDMALSRLPADTDPARIVMVGDTLQTDILGGRAAGVKTALITDFGALKGMDASDAISRSGIVPDFIMPCP
jgi:HAD superfamily hydrolase (TIGR01450 family)